jgi:hypothetical protein
MDKQSRDFMARLIVELEKSQDALLRKKWAWGFAFRS